MMRGRWMRLWWLRRVGELWRARWRLPRSSLVRVRRSCLVLLVRELVRKRKTRMMMMRWKWLARCASLFLLSRILGAELTLLFHVSLEQPATKPTLHKKGSQSSLASSHSSQSQSGSIFSSVFGGPGKASVKKTEPKALKSIQLAAAAARKVRVSPFPCRLSSLSLARARVRSLTRATTPQQEQAEKERKAAIKEEREQKRAEKRLEEDRLKAEEERKVRAEGAERKRKEREEQAIKSSKIVRPKAKVRYELTSRGMGHSR